MKRKVKSAGLGGAITTLLVFALTQFGVEVPGDVGAAAATIIAVFLGYLVPEAE